MKRIGKLFLKNQNRKTKDSGAIANSSGTITESTEYDTFGNATNPLSTRYQFTGREFDDFSGLYHYRARAYDSQIGRFISEDPIGFAGGDVNLYGYVKNRPLHSNDPLGLDDTDRIFQEKYFPEGYEVWVRRNGVDKLWKEEVYNAGFRPENFRCGPGPYDSYQRTFLDLRGVQLFF
jgi:RHS repeat-associated protein